MLQCRLLWKCLDGRRSEKTKLTLKDASIVAHTAGDGMYEITLTCRLKDVAGEIVEAKGLDVKIKSEYEK